MLEDITSDIPAGSSPTLALSRDSAGRNRRALRLTRRLPQRSHAGSLGAIALLSGVAWLGILGEGPIPGLEPRDAMFFALAVAVTALGWLLLQTRARAERDKRATAAEVAQLSHQLESQALAGLSTEIGPHFLFNALQVVSCLLNEDPQRADRALVSLSELLRQVLEMSRLSAVTLQQELELAQRFVGFHRDHSKRRLVFSEAVDPAALDAAVPPLILQPLIENALKHSSGTVAGCRVGLELIVRRHDGYVRIEIHNSGGPDAEIRLRPRPGGIGLPNTEKRLRLFFGEGCDFELRKRIGGGAVASLLIPHWPTSSRQKPTEELMERSDADSNGDRRRRALGA